MGSATWRPTSFVTADNTRTGDHFPSSTYPWINVANMYDDNTSSRGQFGGTTSAKSICLSGGVPNNVELAANEKRLTSLTVSIKTKAYKPEEETFRFVYNVKNTGSSSSDYTDAGDGSQTILTSGSTSANNTAVTKTFTMPSTVTSCNNRGTLNDYAIRFSFKITNTGTSYTIYIYDVSITAEWSDVISSTLSVNPNGGLWNNSTSIQTFTQNSGTTKSIPIPTRSGYHFTGWTRTNTYGTISSLTEVATYTFGATDNVTDYLVANWTAITSTLSVNPNGGNWNGSSSIQTFTQNAGTTKSVPAPTRSDYTFGGWIRANKYGTVTSTGSATTYTFGSSENVTDYLIATWDKFISLSNPSLTYLNEQVSVNNKVLALEQPILYVEVTDGKSLPSQYEQIAYLQSTGDQFIDTGITSQTNIIV